MPYDIIIGRDDADKKRFVKKGLIFIGKGYVKMGQYTSLSNPIYMDIARSHIILVSGKRGCLIGETLVFTDKGYKEIKNFDEKKDKVLSFNKESRKFEWENAELLKYPITKESVLKIELTDGRSIILTKEHPLLMNYGKYIFWRPAQELKINDKIVLPTKLPEIKKDRESLRIARLLGFILADGNIFIKKGRFKDGRGYWYNGTKARIRINNACEEVLLKAKEDFEKEFNITAKRAKRKDCNCEIIEIKHQRIANKFIELGIPKGNKSGIIRIPKIVFGSSNKFKANFISALFDCDGYISSDGKTVGYSSKSRKFLEGLQLLLTHFDIESVIRIKNVKLNAKTYKNYRLFITDNTSIENFKKIGFTNKFKQERLNKHQSNKTKRRKTHYPHEKLVCTRIRFIEEITGIREVYDLSVNKNHSFIANGIISHNSGKSYSLGVIAEELATLPSEERKNIAGLIFDTMGIFWTMKFENEKERSLLEEWQLKPKKTPVKIFIPFGYYEEYEKRGIPVENKFSINPSELNAEDWILTFNLNMTEPTAILIERIISRLKETQKNFTIEDIVSDIEHDTHSEKETKNSAMGLFEAARSWHIFSEQATPISELIQGGKTSILDLSMYSSVGAFNVRALVISLISRKLFNQRMLSRKAEEIQAVQRGSDYLSFKQEREMPLVWLFIDECLVGDTEIITDKAHTPIQAIINKFEQGKKVKVWGFDKEAKKFGYYNVLDVYKKGKRKIINLTTETGREIKCTPEHRVLTRQGFASAFSVNEIATPIIQHYSKNKECIKARILGHLFGDGWANEKFEVLGFSGKKEPDDLNKIKEDLLMLGFKSSNIYSRKTQSRIINRKKKTIKVNGTSHSIQASYKAFRYFKPRGIIIGNKTSKQSKIPEWIKNSDKKVKAEFLAALMGSDGSKVSKAKNARGDFNAVRLVFHKLEELEENAMEFAHEIKEIFESIGIKISNISKKEANIRKDGKETIKIIITLKKDIKNTIKFIEKIGYRYCSEKEIGGNKWLSYLKARLFLKKEREKIYQKALELKKQGLGKTRISKKLNFPEAQIRDWIYMNMKPGLPKKFPDIEEWIKKRQQEDLLFERVFKMEDGGEEEVYDISVDKVHNFVSNGFITHNCHEFLPDKGKTAATDALIQILREGRQPGLSLVMATQQPGALARDAITQADIIISHRVTAMPDIKALNEIMQSYLLENIKRYMDELPSLKGSAIILDDNSERIYPMRIRPKFTWHGGEAPTAIKVEKRI